MCEKKVLFVLKKCTFRFCDYTYLVGLSFAGVQAQISSQTKTTQPTEQKAKKEVAKPQASKKSKSKTKEVSSKDSCDKNSANKSCCKKDTCKATEPKSNKISKKASIPAKK